MTDSKRCKSCGNPVDLEQARAHDGACPWCLAEFTFGPESLGTPAPSSEPAKQFGKYVRTEKLGAGGMGEVWKALDSELNRWVALKFLKDEDPSSTARFQREARTAAGLSHDGIAAIHEVGEIEGRHYIAMQFIQGRTMAHFPTKDRRLVVRLFRDAAKALDHAHRHGVIHRDLKPENLMVEEREDGWHVVILDFGLARPIEGGEKLSQSGEVYGTAAYMSPEQARGEHLDERADLYSLGAAMYEVLTGRPPFHGTNLLELLRKVAAEEPAKPRKLNPRIHRDLETIILKCLEKDRERRYANAHELADDLERFLNSDPILARPPSTLYRLKMTLGKRRAQAVAVAAVLALILTAAVIIPKWRAEAGARTSQETAAREKRERLERARPHLEAGRKILQRLRSTMRQAYRMEDVKSLGRHARAEFDRALAIAPDFADLHLEVAVSHALVDDKAPALEALDRAIAADPDFIPAYLERVRLNMEDYEDLRHGRRGEMKAETPESKALRERLESDLRKVERFSKEYPQQKYAEAMIAFAHGEFETAVQMLGLYLEREPDDGLAHYWRGHALMHLGRPKEAQEEIARALAINAGDTQALFMSGTLKLDQGDPTGALRDYDQVLAYKPDVAGTYFNRGNARRAAGDPQGALADYTRAIELKMKHCPTDPFINRADIKLEQGDFEGALQDYDLAQKADPTDAEVYAGRASILWQLRRVDDMLIDTAKALALNPKLALAYANRGIALADKGDYDGAIADYDKAIELEPKNHLPYFNRGLSKESKGLLDDALADFTRATSVNPRFGPAFNARGKLRREMGQFEAAIQDHSKAIDLDPKDASAFISRGLAKVFMGRSDEAMADFKKGLDLDPRNADGYICRGRAWEDLKDYDAAIADYTRAIELKPLDSDFFNHRGVAREWKGLFDKAIEDYTEAIRLAPRNPHPYANRGSARERLGRLEEAEADFRKALEVAPANWPHRKSVSERLAIPMEVRLFRDGNRLFEERKLREAAAQFERVVKSYPESREAAPSAYNLACAHALLGEKSKGLDWLEKAVSLGWDNLDHTEQDPDLETLRGDARFKKVLQQLQSK